MANISTHGRDISEEHTLSNGETIEFPVSMESTISALILPADRDRANEMLPEDLSPVRAGPGTAAVWIMSAKQRNVGRGSFDPYNEFAVMISATHGPTEGIPYLSALLRTEAYVWHMPVTTEQSREYGEEIWGFPKTVADIEIEDLNGGQRTTVTEDDEHLITFEVDHPPTFSREDTLTTYTEKDGTLLRIRSETSGEMGLWPYSTNFSYSLGDHPQATELRRLDLGDRAFARFYCQGEMAFPAGTPIDEGP